MDYKKIISSLKDSDIIRLMTQLGADRHRETEEALIFPTICHNTEADEASMKLYYYKDSHLFYCYTSCGGMSIFKFLEEYYKTRGIEYDWYNDIYQLVLNCTPRVQEGFVSTRAPLLKDKFGKKRQLVQLEEFPQGVLDIFVKEYPRQWAEEGISKEAMEKFNIRFSISQNKIIIPHYDVDSRLVGIRGRALNDWEIKNVGKYMPVQIEEIWYKHPLSLNLYGLNHTKENIKKTGIVYLFESEKSVLMMESFNIPNCAVAVCGSSLNKFQIDILMKHCQPSEFILCFDKEQDQTDKYFNKLLKICQKYHNYGNFSFIYDIDNLLNLKDSPTDKGEEVFQKLLGRRVKVK